LAFNFCIKNSKWYRNSILSNCIKKLKSLADWRIWPMLATCNFEQK
jgi:hypothetical protein